MTRRALAAVIVALAVALGAANGCHGTDPSANPLKPCPAGQVRRAANIKPPWSYECFTDTRYGAAKHRKKHP